MAMELGIQWLKKILPIKKANILNLYRYREISRTACLQARNVCIWFFHTTGSPLDMLIYVLKTTRISGKKPIKMKNHKHWCQSSQSQVFFYPALKVRAYFGRPVTKSLDSPQWHWLILALIGSLAPMCINITRIRICREPCLYLHGLRIGKQNFSRTF